MRLSVCHCLDCQRRTGSAFGVQARFPEGQIVSCEGESRAWQRTGDSGGVVTYQFCPTCGGTVHYRIDTYPGVVGIPIGGFADPTFPAPKVSVYESRAHPWVRMAHAESMEHHE